MPMWVTKIIRNILCTELYSPGGKQLLTKFHYEPARFVKLSRNCAWKLPCCSIWSWMSPDILTPDVTNCQGGPPPSPQLVYPFPFDGIFSSTSATLILFPGLTLIRNTIKIMSNGRICYEHMPHSKILCVLVLLHLLAQQSGAPRRGPYRDWPRRNSVKVYFLSVFLRSVLGPGYASYVLWVYFEAHIGF